MAPYTSIPLSPAELSYLHTSLSQSPPIRPDGRSPTQFRPLVAETDILPAANGSARICFADGTEAVVGVKAEVEKSRTAQLTGETEREGSTGAGTGVGAGDVDTREAKDGEDEAAATRRAAGKGQDSWLELSIEVPGLRDDDALPVFLSAMLTEALLADCGLKDRLYINRRFHWTLYVDILLLSQPLSYPLPLLSLATHLALLSTRLPALVSEKDEDPLFNDDWEASPYLYRRAKTGVALQRPPVTLLVMAAGDNVIFDPSKEELAVANGVLAISAAQQQAGGVLKMLALRTVDPPSRLTASGTPNSQNTASGGARTLSAADALVQRERDGSATVWRPPRGGMKRGLVTKMIKMVIEPGGVGQEVMDGLQAVET